MIDTSITARDLLLERSAQDFVSQHAMKFKWEDVNAVRKLYADNIEAYYDYRNFVDQYDRWTRMEASLHNLLETNDRLGNAQLVIAERDAIG